MELKKYLIPPGEINIDQGDISKLIGFEFSSLPDPYPSMIAEEISRLPEYINIQGGYRYFREINSEKDSRSIQLDNQVFRVGKQVFKYLEKSVSVAVFVCTAGKEISERSRSLNENGQFIEGYIADLIGTILVEAAMDKISKNLAKEASSQGLKITNCYSPGYCDWHVSEQTSLFSLLPLNFCGIHLSSSSLMIPVKSVSGIIGIGPEVIFQEYVCEDCKSPNCLYRKTGRKGEEF